jgi:hypothetical protein
MLTLPSIRIVAVSDSERTSKYAESDHVLECAQRCAIRHFGSTNDKTRSLMDPSLYESILGAVTCHLSPEPVMQLGCGPPKRPLDTANQAYRNLRLDPAVLSRGLK